MENLKNPIILNDNATIEALGEILNEVKEIKAKDINEEKKKEDNK